MLRPFLVTAALLAPAGVVLADTPPSPLELARPIAQYKLYVTREAADLVKQTRFFTDAVKAGRLEEAKDLYASTRVPYERIEPVAELFGDLDPAIDARADDHEAKEADPAFSGFHRIEYGLFEKNSTEGLAPVADRLMADVNDLQSRINGLALPPEKVVGGAAALLEEVAATKITGEEDRYSHTDLWDFNANVEGAQKIVELLKPQTERADPKLSAKIERNFKTVETILAKYRLPDGGLETYDKLTDSDRRALQGPVTVLAEDLSTLRGTLGLD